MKELLELTVTQIRIFPNDALGYRYFRRQSSMDAISGAFALDPQPTFPDGFPVALNKVVFGAGEFRDGSSTYLINSLTIEERRILFSIAANSNVAAKFYQELKKLLTTLDLRDPVPEYEPLFLAEETVSVAKLDFGMADMLHNSRLQDFDTRLSQVGKSNGLGLDVYPSGVTFRIRYPQVPDSIARNKISLVDKEFAIQVRQKTDPSDSVFFVSSPFDSDTHFELIAELERVSAS